MYCYKVILFELKNVSATYQRVMNKVFVEQIGRNINVYVDDILVNSKDPQQYWHDLEEMFKTLQKYNMRLNPKKCAFGVKVGKFLRFMLIKHGIEANPTKCQPSSTWKTQWMPERCKLWMTNWHPLLSSYPG